MTHRNSSGFKASVVTVKTETQFALFERALPDFVLAVLRAHGVRRLAGGME